MDARESEDDSLFCAATRSQSSSPQASIRHKLIDRQVKSSASQCGMEMMTAQDNWHLLNLLSSFKGDRDKPTGIPSTLGHVCLLFECYWLERISRHCSDLVLLPSGQINEDLRWIGGGGDSRLF
eukprot:1139377-Pelagomonas_calceolata.AAC.2